jgi:hypothetical protein
MENLEILSLKRGTKIKVKKEIECHEDYKKGGTLVFQTSAEKDKDEFNFGIEVSFGVCYMFSAKEYELA